MRERVNRRDWMKTTGLAAGAMVAGAMKASAAETKREASPQPLAKSSVMFQRNIPVRYEVDVFVAGGGPAGTAAAVAARSQGATVYLAEAHSCLGGMGTAGRVPLFMPVSDGVNFLPGGFGKQVITRLEKEKGLRGPAHDIEALKRVYDAMVASRARSSRFIPA